MPPIIAARSPKNSIRPTPLTADGRVELDNINGAVHISSWDRNEVKVDAVKYADTKERLDEAKIEIDSGKDYLSIRTKYPEPRPQLELGLAQQSRRRGIHADRAAHGAPGRNQADQRLARHHGRERRSARLLHQRTAGGARSCRPRPAFDRSTAAWMHDFDQLAGQSVELSSVNGSVDLTIPSDSKAELEASTVSGGIDNDFGLHVNHHQFVGHDLRGELGSGGTHIKLANVNGRIEIHHAQDGRALSPVKDLSHRDKDDDDDRSRR